MSKLILVRHGQSKWNLSNRFTGQIDVSISSLGVEQCFDIGNQIKNIKIDRAFCSCLTRSKETLSIILSRTKKSGIYIDEQIPNYNHLNLDKYPLNNFDLPVYSNCLLNERSYGSLEGMDKNEARNKYGEQKVLEWRRDFLATPPDGESLQDVYHRTIPYFLHRIIPLLQKNENVIISAHGNSLRTIIKNIENISDDKISQLELYTGQTIIYDYKNNKFASKKSHLSFQRPISWKKITHPKKV